MQERFTHQLAAAVEELSGARGVLIVVEALHMCMVRSCSTKTAAQRSFICISCVQLLYQQHALICEERHRIRVVSERIPRKRPFLRSAHENLLSSAQCQFDCGFVMQVARGVEKHASTTTTMAARGSLVAISIARCQLLLSLCLS